MVNQRKGITTMDMIKQLSLAGLVPVIAVNDAQDAIPLCKALSDGGLPVAEITFRTSAADRSPCYAAIRRSHIRDAHPVQS